LLSDCLVITFFKEKYSVENYSRFIGRK